MAASNFIFWWTNPSRPLGSISQWRHVFGLGFHNKSMRVRFENAFLYSLCFSHRTNITRLYFDTHVYFGRKSSGVFAVSSQERLPATMAAPSGKQALRFLSQFGAFILTRFGFWNCFSMLMLFAERADSKRYESAGRWLMLADELTAVELSGVVLHKNNPRLSQ